MASRVIVPSHAQREFPMNKITLTPMYVYCVNLVVILANNVAQLSND